MSTSIVPIETLLLDILKYPGPENFEVDYPEPALTLDLEGKLSESGGGEVEKQVLLTTQDDKSMRALFGGEDRRTHVAFLKKSERNPFKNIISLGRAPTNDISLPSLTISKVHAVFMKVGRDWKLADRGAKNGLFVNRVLVERGHTVGPLQDGTLLCFGTGLEATFHTPAGLFNFLRAHAQPGR